MDLIIKLCIPSTRFCQKMWRQYRVSARRLGCLLRREIWSQSSEAGSWWCCSCLFKVPHDLLSFKTFVFVCYYSSIQGNQFLVLGKWDFQIFHYYFFFLVPHQFIRSISSESIIKAPYIWYDGSFKDYYMHLFKINCTFVSFFQRSDRFWWQGQNRRTGEIGSFPRNIVEVQRKLGGKICSLDIWITDWWYYLDQVVQIIHNEWRCISKVLFILFKLK